MLLEIRHLDLDRPRKLQNAFIITVCIYLQNAEKKGYADNNVIKN